MRGISIEERATKLAHYIIETKETVRSTAKTFGISKSTVQIDTNIIQKWMVFFVVRKFIQEMMVIGYKYN